MSSYTRLTFHPIDKKWKMADWLDDYFGSHYYGVKFEGEDWVYDLRNCPELLKEREEKENG